MRNYIVTFTTIPKKKYNQAVKRTVKVMAKESMSASNIVRREFGKKEPIHILSAVLDKEKNEGV